MDYEILFKKINNKQAKVGVIGLGYVGLPLALLFVKKGFYVTGFVRNRERLEILKKGKSNLLDLQVTKDFKKAVLKRNLSIKVTNPKDLSTSDILIVCVPTPVTSDKMPDLSDLKKVASCLSKVDLSGRLIINESTVAPFTTRDLFGGFNGGYFLACSPERIDPGNKTKKTNNIPKVIGGVNKQSLVLAKSLYEQIMNNTLVEVSSLEAAEMAKMLENTYRAVNIALVNEFARLSEKIGIDILEVINAAKTKWSFQVHFPGVGVGGHCIPVDPYYVLKLAKGKNVGMKVVEEGLAENEEMPSFVAEKIEKEYRKGAKVLVYGITYKKDVNDIRESPVIVLCNILKKRNIEFSVYDPFVSEEIVKSLGFERGQLRKVDIFVVGTDHSVLAKDYRKAIGKDSIVIDGRNYFIEKVGKKVLGIGRNLW